MSENLSRSLAISQTAAVFRSFWKREKSWDHCVSRTSPLMETTMMTTAEQISVLRSVVIWKM